MRFLIMYLFCFLLISCMGSSNNENIQDMADKINILNKSVLDKQGKYDYKGAIKDAEEILKLKDNIGMRICLGSLKLHNGDYLGAQKEFETVLAQVDNLSNLNKKNYLEVLLGLADTKLHEEDFDGALEDYTKVFNTVNFLELETEEKIRILSSMAKAEWRVGNYKEALINFKKALAVEERGYLKIGMSRVKVAMGDIEGAFKDCYEAIEVEDSARTRIGLAEVRESSRDLAGALKEYKTALTRNVVFDKYKKELGNEEKIHIRICIGRLEEQMHNYKEAMKEYEQAVKLGDTSNKAKEGIDRIKDKQYT